MGHWMCPLTSLDSARAKKQTEVGGYLKLTRGNTPRKQRDIKLILYKKKSRCHLTLGASPARRFDGVLEPPHERVYLVGSQSGRFGEAEVLSSEGIHVIHYYLRRIKFPSR